MAYVKILGGMTTQWWRRVIASFGTTSVLTIDATGEKAAYIGHVIWPNADTTKDITKVGIRFGTVVKAGGSGLTLSLQDVNTAAGPPYQPDETQDQTVAIANGNASFASNTWLQSAALSANRTVAKGALLAVVLEFDGGGRLGADSVILSMLSSTETGSYANAGATLKTSGAWANQLGMPNVILEFTDGTFGTLTGAIPFSALNNHTYKSDTATDEYALKWQLPFAGKFDAVDLFIYCDAATSDFDIVAYDSDGTTALGTISVDANAIVSASFREARFCFSSEIAFAANTSYYLSVKPTQATSNVRINYQDVSAVGHLDSIFGGQNWHMASRADGGAWSNVTTRRPFLAPVISSIDTGGAGGVGALISGGLIR